MQVGLLYRGIQAKEHGNNKFLNNLKLLLMEKLK